MDDEMTEPFHLAPEPFRSNLRDQVLAHMDEQVLAPLDPMRTVEQDPIEREPARPRQIGWLLVAAAGVVVVGLGVLATLDRSFMEQTTEVVAAEDASCAVFVAAAPSPGELEIESSRIASALVELESLLVDLRAELAAAGELGSSDLVTLDLAIGGVREAHLDSEAGDQAGAEAALAFALTTLNTSDRLELSYGEEGFSCR